MWIIFKVHILAWGIPWIEEADVLQSMESQRVRCNLATTRFLDFTECVTILFVLFWFFGPEAYGILIPQPRIEPIPSALKGKVLTTGPPGESHNPYPWTTCYILKST